MTHKPRILFTTPVLKHPAVGGPYLRIENSIKALSEISELHLHSRIALNDYEISFYKSFCKEIYRPSSNSIIKRCINFSKNVLNNYTQRRFEAGVFNSEYRDLLNIADTIKADLIWLGYGNISYPFLKYIKANSNYKVVVDTDSVYSRFILRGLPFARNDKMRQKIETQGKEKEKEESWGTQLADVTTTVSQVDADYYSDFARDSKQIKLFSNVIDLETYKLVPPKPDNFKTPCIYLAGTFWSGSPMEEAALWVKDKVLPSVRQKIPDIHFYIVGRGSDKVLSDLKDPGISIMGELPTVLPYLCHANVAIVPLKFESGTRFKIIEAGACKIPIVSTTLGAEGLPVEDRTHILIADTPESFANAIIDLLTNPDMGDKLKENCYKLIEENCSIDTAIKEAQKILNILGLAE